jgi:hypothetical protein
MEYKEILIYLVAVVQAMISYIFLSHKSETREELNKLEKKIEKIETGEFVEKIVKNVIYSPESRTYFKSIFTEALNHQSKNDNAISLSILNHLEAIEEKIK